MHCKRSKLTLKSARRHPFKKYSELFAFYLVYFSVQYEICGYIQVIAGFLSFHQICKYLLYIGYMLIRHALKHLNSLSVNYFAPSAEVLRDSRIFQGIIDGNQLVSS
jgi:hypothetical protein